MAIIPALWLLLVVSWDIRFRQVPLWQVTLAVALGLTYGWSWTGMGLGLAAGLLAGVPGGDLRAMVGLGGLAGMQVAGWTFAGAFALTLWAWKRGLTGVPWTVYLGVVFPFISSFFPSFT